jgi:glycosyltransferase involved in cell wall biosynthesis
LKFRILHCIPSMLGGGAEKQLCYLAAGLVGLGHEVHVAYNFEGPNLSLLRQSGARLHRLDARRAFDPRAALDIAAVLRRERIQLIQTWLRRMDNWGGVAAGLAGVPWLLTERCQSAPIDERTASALGLRAMAPRALAVVANSENAAEIWRRGVAKLPVRVVPNAIPLDRIEPVAAADRRELGFPEGAPLILFAGRFATEKNIPLLGASCSPATATTSSAG